jgi:PAS domain S-box-containing protein
MGTVHHDTKDRPSYEDELRTVAMDARRTGTLSPGEVERLLRALEPHSGDDHACRTLRSILDAIPDGVVVAGPTGLISHANAAVGRILALDHAVLPGNRLDGSFRCYLPDRRTVYRHDELPIVRALRGEVVEDEELLLELEGHEGLWLAVSASPLHDPSGAIAGAVARFRDVTDERKAEDVLHELTLALENAAEGIARVGQSGHYIAVNGAYASLLGYHPDEMLGMHWTRVVPPDAQAAAQTAYEEMTARGKVRFETRGLRKDGTTFHEEVVIIKNVTRDGRQRGHHCFARDITHRKEAEAALAARAEELARSNADLEQFAYVASHDLQEPLRMVASYVQLLARRYRGQLDPDADTFISYAVDGVTRMRGLITGLLEYARAGAPRREPAFAAAGEALDGALADLQPLIAQSGCVVTRADLPEVPVERSQLTQLFTNLVGNALKFREPTRAPRIHVDATPDGARWLFSVEDNGIGIGEEYRERIFAIFQRLHDRDSYPGTGIGLAICKKIVERHGGRIWNEPAPGGGTTFRFTLPRAG